MPFSKFLIISILLLSFTFLKSQGLTTASIEGFIVDVNEMPITNSELEVTFKQSGFTYKGQTNNYGKFYMTNLPIGNYRIEVKYLDKIYVLFDNLLLNLGHNNLGTQNLAHQGVTLSEITITSSALVPRQTSAVNKNISQNEIQYLPFPGRSILDLAGLQSLSYNSGFGGKSSRDNFISIDGSPFNNTYGIGGPLATLAGNVVGAEPISMDAIEQIQINLSPFDVRQGGFTGSGIHAVTKSGKNDFSGTVYSYFSNNSLVGRDIEQEEIPISNFNQRTIGTWFGGALKKDKLFYSVSFETISKENPASNFIASRPGATSSSTTRVLASDLDDLSEFLFENYNYQTGPYENFDLSTRNEKLMVKLDWHINATNHFLVRYNFLNASQQLRTTNSALFGAGARTDNPFAMTFQSSGETRKVRAHSLIGELKSYINLKFSNRLAVGYSFYPDKRIFNGALFPSVDILQSGRTYISFGSHLFASNNSIDQKIAHVQNELSYYADRHVITVGASVEHFQFEYKFTPAIAGSYIFNSLEDFYNSTPIGTTTPIGLSNGIGRPSTFAIQYSTLANNEDPVVKPSFLQSGVYLQDVINLGNINLTTGIRLDVTSYFNPPQNNPIIESLIFENAHGQSEMLNTGILPSTNFIISPRMGFQWNVNGKNKIWISGGTGLFSGRSPFVRLGDQYVNNGLSQGLIRARNNMANAYPFNPDPRAYIPDEKGPANTYDINVTSADFKMPQIWKSNLDFSYNFNSDLSASFNLLYGNEINRDFVRNANLSKSDLTVARDGRFEFTDSRLNNPPVIGAYVLDNTSLGYQLYTTFSVHKNFSNNWMASLAYSFGRSKDITSFSASSARVDFRSLPVSGNSNVPELAFSDNDQPHRLVGSAVYKIKNSKIGAMTLGLFIEWVQHGRFSYTYSGRGDINNDGVPVNDLIFIPGNSSDIDLENYNLNGEIITAEVQWQALDNFISNSTYLSANRGKIAQRNGGLLPSNLQIDLRLLQDIGMFDPESKHKLQLSIDFINLTNFINSSWGIRQFPANTRPIEFTQQEKYRVNPNLLNDEFINDIGLNSRWQIQLGLRFTFN